MGEMMKNFDNMIITKAGTTISTATKDGCTMTFYPGIDRQKAYLIKYILKYTKGLTFEFLAQFKIEQLKSYTKRLIG